MSSAMLCKHMHELEHANECSMGPTMHLICLGNIFGCHSWSWMKDIQKQPTQRHDEAVDGAKHGHAGLFKRESEEANGRKQ